MKKYNLSYDAATDSLHSEYMHRVKLLGLTGCL